jgi:hypothetical protein
MERLSPMDFHRYPSNCKVTLSYKYFLAIIVLRGDFGNKSRSEGAIPSYIAHVAIHTHGFYNELAKAYKHRPETSMKTEEALTA